MIRKTTGDERARFKAAAEKLIRMLGTQRATIIIVDVKKEFPDVEGRLSAMEYAVKRVTQELN